MGSSYLYAAMKMRYISLFCFVLYSELHEIMGHGAMYYPMPWHATSDCTPDMSPHDCKFALKIDYPPGEECTHNSSTNGCSRSASHTAWFTNYTTVPEVTLQEENLQRFTGTLELNTEEDTPTDYVRSTTASTGTSRRSASKRDISSFMATRPGYTGTPMMNISTRLAGSRCPWSPPPREPLLKGLSGPRSTSPITHNMTMPGLSRI